MLKSQLWLSPDTGEAESELCKSRCAPLQIPSSISEHNHICLAVIVIISDDRFISILSELHETELIGNQIQQIPRAVRWTEDRQFCRSVIVKAGRLRNVIGSSKADGSKACHRTQIGKPMKIACDLPFM